MRWLILLVTAILSSCGSDGQGRHGTFRIGIDSTWSPIDFKEQQSYVNGYVENLLLEISRYSGVQFEKISANWDSLFDGLIEGRYDAVFSSMSPYEFNLAKYDFSENILDLGPVLITTANAQMTKLDQLSLGMVGIISGDPAAFLLQPYPSIIIRSFNSIPELLDAIVTGEIEGALLDRLSAVSYIRDLYAGRLKVASNPLTKAGLHAVCIKNKGRFIAAFNQSIEQMKKKKTVDALQKKWNLSFYPALMLLEVRQRSCSEYSARTLA